MTLGDIVGALPKLTSDQLKALVMAIKVEQTSRQKLPYSDSQFDNDLFQAVLGELGIKGSENLLKKTKAYSIWMTNQEFVHDLINKITENHKVKKPALIQLKVFLVQLILKDMKEKKLNLDIRNIATYMSHVKRVFEKNFPGYLAPNLAYLVLKNLTKEK